VKEAQTHRVSTRRAYKAYYDTLGQLVRILNDTNADGRPDRIAHYKDGKTIFLIEIDLDHDGWIDRFEHYDPAGKLAKVGQWQHKRGKEDTWTTLGPDGQPSRVEWRRPDGAPTRPTCCARARWWGEIDADRNADGPLQAWRRAGSCAKTSTRRQARPAPAYVRGAVLSALPLP
jgi:hypothetical protein